MESFYIINSNNDIVWIYLPDLKKVSNSAGTGEVYDWRKLDLLIENSSISCVWRPSRYSESHIALMKVGENLQWINSILFRDPIFCLRSSHNPST